MKKSKKKKKQKRHEEETNFLCADCQVDTVDEYYMVIEKIWKQATQDKPADMLCIGCLETRIGRKLKLDDFLECPLKYQRYGSSDRLLDRLQLKPVESYEELIMAMVENELLAIWFGKEMQNNAR